MITKLPVRVLDGKLSKIDELELRIMNMDAIIKDLKSELASIRVEIKEEDLKRIEKLNKYQKLVDSIWTNKKTTAV